jgi:hypothetical protein
VAADLELESAQPEGARFRLTLVRVLVVQTVTLAALWWLQTRYGL